MMALMEISIASMEELFGGQQGPHAHAPHVTLDTVVLTALAVQRATLEPTAISLLIAKPLLSHLTTDQTAISTALTRERLGGLLDPALAPTALMGMKAIAVKVLSKLMLKADC